MIKPTSTGPISVELTSQWQTLQATTSKTSAHAARSSRRADMTPITTITDWTDAVRLARELAPEGTSNHVVWAYACELRVRAERAGLAWGTDWARIIPLPIDQALVLELLRAQMENNHISW